MGASVSKQIGDVMEKNMDNQKEFQIEMAMKQRQLMLATKRALGREIFKYYSSFVGIVVIGLLGYAIKNKKPTVLLPILPLSVMLAFQYDLSYGKMLLRAQAEAFGIIKDQALMLYPPWNNGLMTPRQYQQKIPYSILSGPFSAIYYQQK